MLRKVNVIISSAGRRVELIQCFRTDAKDLGLELKIVAVDADPELSAACQVADGYYKVPRCGAGNFVPTILDICKREEIDLIVPTIDTELEVYAARKCQFQDNGISIAISDQRVIEMARNKLETATFFQKNGIPTPKTARLHGKNEDFRTWKWPIILKPISGSSSKGIHIVSSIDKISSLDIESERYIAQELWQGREYTVNLFFDKTGELKCIIPHWRCETRGGEVSKGITLKEPSLIEAATKLGKIIPGAYGPLCFQAIVNSSNEVALFELNARFGGGYPLAHKAGAQFSKWLLEDVAGLPSTANNNWHSNIGMLRYDAAVFKEM